MKKSIDFSKGVRGKHSGINLKILGSAETVWAVCLTRKDKNLIPFKLYQIEVFSHSEELRTRNEAGEMSYFPASWFVPLEVPEKTLGLLEKAA